MTFTDLFRIAFHNLWIRKLRTALNLVGVVIASVLLLSTLAATEGIKKAVMRFVENSEHSRKFRIYSDYDRSIQPPEEQVAVSGDMSDRRRARIRRILEEKWREENQQRRWIIAADKIDRIRQSPHIAEVSPRYSVQCDIDLERLDSLISQTTEDSTAGTPSPKNRILARSCSLRNVSLGSRIIAGSMIPQNDLQQVLIHEGLAYQLGFQSDSDLERLVGQPIKLAFPLKANRFQLFDETFYRQSIEQQVKWFTILNDLLAGKNISDLDKESREMLRQFMEKSRQKPKAGQARLLELQFRVCGVFRRRDDQDIQNVLEQFDGGYGNVLIHHTIFDEKLSDSNHFRGTNTADVYVDQYANLERAIEECKDLGVRAISPTDIIQRIVGAVEKSRFTMAGIVLIVLFISAVGISNTMFISLVERTEEIGIMKAVGAGNRDVLWMILWEGLITGLIGGVVSVLITFLVVFVGNEILRNYVESRAAIQLDGPVFALSTWMVLSTMTLSIVTTTLAGLWPAWRASKIDPIVAMGRR